MKIKKNKKYLHETIYLNNNKGIINKIVIILSILYLYYTKNYASSILNYPIFIVPTIFTFNSLIIFIKYFALLKKEFIMIETKNKIYYIVSRIVIGLVINMLVTIILLVPIDYYIVHKSKLEKTQKLKCKIEQVISRPGYRTTSFKLNGEFNTVSGYTSVMEEIIKSNNYSKYVLEIEVKKSILGTYILNHWKIVEKNNLQENK